MRWFTIKGIGCKLSAGTWCWSTAEMLGNPCYKRSTNIADESRTSHAVRRVWTFSSAPVHSLHMPRRLRICIPRKDLRKSCINATSYFKIYGKHSVARVFWRRTKIISLIRISSIPKSLIRMNQRCLENMKSVEIQNHWKMWEDITHFSNTNSQYIGISTRGNPRVLKRYRRQKTRKEIIFLRRDRGSIKVLSVKIQQKTRKEGRRDGSEKLSHVCL